jgi:mRNA interferase RelE/StbE
VGQRYRIVYRVERSIVTVVVVAAGIRKEGSREDIYRVAARLIRLGLL